MSLNHWLQCIQQQTNAKFLVHVSRLLTAGDDESVAQTAVLCAFYDAAQSLPEANRQVEQPTNYVRIRKDPEGRTRGLTEVLSPNFSGRSEENHNKPQSG
jgi:hypothetical protein